MAVELKKYIQLRQQPQKQQQRGHTSILGVEWSTVEGDVHIGLVW